MSSVILTCLFFPGKLKTTERETEHVEMTYKAHKEDETWHTWLINHGHQEWNYEEIRRWIEHDVAAKEKEKEERIEKKKAKQREEEGDKDTELSDTDAESQNLLADLEPAEKGNTYNDMSQFDSDA